MKYSDHRQKRVMVLQLEAEDAENLLTRKDSAVFFYQQTKGTKVPKLEANSR